MSIKTPKRLVLGLIASLVLAPFSAVAPASAAAVAIQSISLATAATTHSANVTVDVRVTVNTGNMANAADTADVKAYILSKPTTGTALLVSSADAGVVSTDVVSTGSSATLGLLNISPSSTNTLPAGTIRTIGSFRFVPTVAGTYTLRVWNDTGDAPNGIVDIGEAFQDISVTVGAAVTGLTEFANSATTATATRFVPSVSAAIVEASGRVGQMVGFAPNYLVKVLTNGTGASYSLTSHKANLNYTVTNPAGAAVSVVSAKTAGVASTQQDIAGTGSISTTNTLDITTASAINGSTVFFNPATAGVYTITVWHDAVDDNLVGAGEASSTVTLTVAADGVPSITFTKYGSNPTSTQDTLVKVSLRNGTTPVSLATNETLRLTGTASVTDFNEVTTCNAAGCTLGAVADNPTTLDLTSTNFNGNGDAWFKVQQTLTAGGTTTITAAIIGGTAAGASGSLPITVVQTSGTGAYVHTLVPNADSIVNVNSLLATVPSKGVTGDAVTQADATRTWTVKTGVATSVVARYTIGADSQLRVYSATVTDTEGLLTGVPGATYVLNALTPTTAAATSATTAANFTVAIPATTDGLAAGTALASIQILGATNRTINITNASSAANRIVVDPSSVSATTYAIRAGSGTSNTFSATVVDQFGNAMASQAVTARVINGRNLQSVATNLLSDANGKVSFTVADTHTGTLLLTDTVNITSGSASGVITVNYATYLPASKITVTGGGSADIAPAITYNYINTGASGASATLVTITATVTDANGGTLPAGIPVNWTISGLTGTSAIFVDPTTGFDWKTTLTNSSGEATTRVYAWAVGTVTVTATSGTATGTGKINFANSGKTASTADAAPAADARVLSATVNGNIVTVKVVDRYGNPVERVSVTATRTAGTGYFGGSAASSAVASTGVNGTVDFIVLGGGATIKVDTTVLNVGQTSSAAGFVGATAIVATGIGASLAPAGVQTATVSVAAPPAPEPVYEKPTLSVVQSGGRIFLSGTAEEGEGDIIIYVKRVGTTAWKERAKTLEVAAPGDFNGSIKAPRGNVVIRVKQEGTGLFSNQVIIVK